VLEAPLGSLELHPPRSTPVAGECALLGEGEKALNWLERAFRLHDPLLLGLRGDQQFDGLRADPAFQGLLRRLSPPEQALLN
jgi:hypothetical protein